MEHGEEQNQPSTYSTIEIFLTETTAIQHSCFVFCILFERYCIRMMIDDALAIRTMMMRYTVKYTVLYAGGFCFRFEESLEIRK